MMTEMSLLKDFEALCKYVRECTGCDEWELNAVDMEQKGEEE